MINEIVWVADFELGIEEIDAQHKSLCRIINRCLKKAKGHLPEISFSDVFNELLDYTKWHFECEESMMRIYNYPDFPSHEKEHKILLKKLEEKKKLILAKDFDAYTFGDFLFSWFGGHSFGYDKKMTVFFREKWSLNEEP